MIKENVFNKKLTFPLFGNKRDVYFQSEFYIDHYNAGIFDITPSEIFKPGELKACITHIKKKQPKAIILLRHGTAGQNKLSKNIDILPSNRALGLNARSEDVFESAFIISNELKSLGVDLIINDILGVNLSKENPVLGTRSFSDDIYKVLELSYQYIKGIQQGGLDIICSGFPGKGDVKHYYQDKITTYKRDLDSMFLDELIPYVNIIKKGIKFLELSDLYYFKESSTVHEPATISREIVDYLRKPLDYKGILFSYPIYRKNFRSYDGFTLLKRCVEAGCDIVYLPGELKENINILDNLMVEISSGEFPLFSSKTIKLNNQLNIEESLYYLKKENSDVIEKIDEHIALSFDADKFSFIKDSDEPIVLFPDLISSSVEEGEEFYKSIKYYKRKSIPIKYLNCNSEDEISHIIESVKNREVLIVSSGVYNNKHLSDLFLMINRHSSRCAIISVGTEYEKQFFPDIPYFCIGTDLERTFKRVIKEIFKNRY